MYEEIKLVIALACIAVLFVNSEPTIRLREWTYKTIYKCKSYNVWHYRLLCCAMCSGLYIGLIGLMIVGGDILLAPVVSVLAELISKKLNNN